MRREATRTKLRLALTALVALTAGSAGGASAPDEPPAVTGRVLGVEGRPAPGVRVLLGCTGDGGLQARAVTDVKGRFALGTAPDGRLECTVRSIDLEDGLVPAEEELTLSAGETARIELVLAPGDPLTVDVRARNRPVDGGTVVAIGEDRSFRVPVRSGEARFSGIPGPVRLYFRGRVPGIPEGQASGCRLLAELFPDEEPVDPAADPSERADLADLDLRPIRARLAETEGDEEPSFRLLIEEALALGSLDQVSVAPGDVVFPCVSPGELVLRVLRDEEPILTQKIKVAPGSPALELLDLDPEGIR